MILNLYAWIKANLIYLRLIYNPQNINHHDLNVKIQVLIIHFLMNQYFFVNIFFSIHDLDECLLIATKSLILIYYYLVYFYSN